MTASGGARQRRPVLPHAFVCVVSCMTIAFVSIGCKGAYLVDPAPLSVRNQHPVQLTAMLANARPTSALSKGVVETGANVDWTNLWLRPGKGTDRIELDGELVRITPSVRFGLGAGFDVGVAVPLLNADGGVLDTFVENWHHQFGLPQNERDRFDQDRFTVRVDRATPSGTQTAWELQRTTLAIQDVPIELAWFPVGSARGSKSPSDPSDSDPLSFGLRLGIELPTGDEDRGLGNGSVDTMLGFVAGYHWERFAIYAWGGHTFMREPPSVRETGLRWRDPSVVGTGVEFAVAPRLSLSGQIEWETSLLENLDETHANRTQALFWLGGRWAVSDRTTLEASVGEDAIRSVSPDVTFAFGLRHRW